MITRLLMTLLLAASARAAVVPSGDQNGADLIIGDGDTLSGTYTNVGLFQIGTGVTAIVAATAAGPNLIVYAATVSISGVLDGSGRGQPGGNGGQVPSGNGQSGTGGGPAAAGGGTGAASTKGGGGGGGGGSGGAGAGDSGGGVGAPGGSGYGSTGTVTSPISADDLYQGSGGGGGGANANVGGGSGASGGAAIYIEAASMTVTGAILVDASTAAPVTFGAVGAHEGGGGGGGGGTILLRASNELSLADGSILSAKGGGGGNVSSSFANPFKAPGGGGGGGRVKLFYRSAVFGAVFLSTAAGTAGGLGGFAGAVDASTPPAAGAVGSVSFGVVASSPTSFAAFAVHATSISWTWNAAPSFGDAPSASRLYRIFPSSSIAPLPSPQKTAASSAGGVIEDALTPNTTYSRYVTAFTDWGDSVPSASVSTHTLAETPVPAAAAFTSVSEAGLTLGWSGGANPSYTIYEVDAATSADFSSSVSASFAAALSTSPTGLTPNTTCFFRVRAVNIDGVPTAFFTTQATATLAAVPASPAVGSVHITSAVFTWSAGANPPDTAYTAQVSTDNFFTLVDSSLTLSTSATFFALTPGLQYFLRAHSVNRNGVPSDFTTVLSTTMGNLSDTTAPAAPGVPVCDRSFSSDGSADFAWTAPASPVGIFDYNLIVGSFAGGSDLFNGSVVAASHSVTGMLSGRSYYAQVRARSNAGVYSVFSPVSAAVPVYIAASNPPIGKAFCWPNPFDPAKGGARIAFYLEEAADVSLKVHTLQGRAIAARSQSFPAGNQIMTWDGQSDSGVRVAPGGYIAVIEKRYGSRVSVQKLKIAVLY